MTDRETVRRAVREIRREGYKAAVLHGVVEATAAALAANLLVGRLPAVSLPESLPGDGRLVAAGAVGLAVFALSVGLRARHYTVERFEAENPVVADALRTARDAAEDGTDSTMVRRLYADVADRLGATSAAGFVNTRALAAGVVAVLVLSGATLGAAVAGVELARPDPAPAGGGGGNGGGGGGGTADRDYDGLRDGDQVLGDPQEVDRGTEDLLANVTASAGGEEGDGRNRYEDSGYESADPGVSAAQAGFDEGDAVEDADLVREYTLRLNQRDSDD